jgi:hypothetical protein
MNPQQIEKTIHSAAVLANATDLACNVILNIAGNSISNSINGSPIMRASLVSLIQSRILQNLANRRAA